MVYWGRWRVESVLAVSRAVGDAQLMPYITADPDVIEKDIEEDDMFLVVCSDGVWDAMSNDDVAKFVVESTCADDDFGEVSMGRRCDDERLRWTARKLCVEAERRGSGDNASAVVVCLK